MIRPRLLARFAVATLAAALPASVQALPTMIRSGYTTCGACHIAPQGAGPLNDYGRGIDQAQSLRGGEYRPAEDGLLQTLSLDGRIRQDVRLVMQQQGKWAGQAGVSTLRARLMYRAVAPMGSHLRFSGTLTGENEGGAAPRPARAYDPAIPAQRVFLNTALLHYRVNDALEFAVGRDQLPTGINVPDLGLFTKARNRLGFYDSPTQVKAVWGRRRYQLMPFAYGPGGQEPAGAREHGAGSLAEFDVFGKQRTVVGMAVQRASTDHGSRQLVGGYTRLGFGRWGVLAEHDVTLRDRDPLGQGEFRQDASYTQVFWAARDWLVASAIAERLRVDGPTREDLNAGKVEVASRLTSQATVVVGARLEQNVATRRLSKSLSVQLALKTID